MDANRELIKRIEEKIRVAAERIWKGGYRAGWLVISGFGYKGTNLFQFF